MEDIGSLDREDQQTATQSDVHMCFLFLHDASMTSGCIAVCPSVPL